MGVRQAVLCLLSIVFLISGGTATTETATVQNQAPTLVLVSPPTPQPATAEAIDVEVVVTGAANLGAFEFDLVYDRSLVRVIGITLRDFPGATGACDPTEDRCAGHLGPVERSNATSVGAYSYGTGPGATGQRLLAVLHLQPTGLSGTTVLEPVNALTTDVSANPVTPATQGATLTLTNEATVYLPVVFKHPGGQTSVDRVKEASDNIPRGRTPDLTAVADTRHSYFSPTADATCPDFDGSGQVDTVDVLAVVDRWRSRSSDPAWDDRLDLDGDGTITIIDIMQVSTAWGRQCQILPPDPADVAPALDAGVATDLHRASEFLYTGDPPIQTGVTPDTIDPRRVAVLRGRVRTRDGQPLPGVTITIHGRSDYGQTVSRADGMFDMVVNGGSPLTVNYNIEGYLQAQRQIRPSWQRYAWLPDVVLIPLDAEVTAIDLSSNAPMQVAHGSVISDSDGIRRATLLFPAGTQAELVLPGGVTQTLTTLHVRATEYTVGESGPQAMPAELPPQSGYTYAVEYSVDEAIAAGAVDVRFDRPVIHYVENFLDFPVGMPVPVGYYDRAKATWVPSDNGQVIEILTITDGLAELDIDGDGVADDAAALAVLGITETERAQLADLYQPGQTLWRVPITHFTPWDCNWPYGPPPDGTPPAGGPPAGDDPVDDPCLTRGSIIECQTQTLREMVDIAGTPFSLHYSSNRVPGRTAANRVEIPLSDSTPPAILKRIELEVAIGGQRFQRSFPAAARQRYTFVWDGRDAYGRMLHGVQPVTIRIGYVYTGVYQDPARIGRAFAAFSGVPITGSRARQEVTLWQEWQRSLGPGPADPRIQGIGGWTLSVHHAYDPAGRVLYLGDGRRRSAQTMDAVITTAAGNGTNSYTGDGGPAARAGLWPNDLAVAPDGTLYIATALHHVIRRVGQDGIITTVAGTGARGYSGDDGPATQAKLNRPQGVAVGPDGSLYIADMDNYRVRRVGPDGVITTVAGDGTFGASGDGGPAVRAQLHWPTDVAVGPDGSLYIATIASQSYGRIRRVGPDGIISTVAGDSTCCYGGDGGPATRAKLWNPRAISVGPDGSLYIADTWNQRVRRVGLDGIIRTVAGTGFTGDSGDGGRATQARFRGPSGIAVGADGSFSIVDQGNQRVRWVRADGIINTVAGGGNPPDRLGDGGPATQALLGSPQGVAVGPDGSLYIADPGQRRVRRVTSRLPGTSFFDITIPSADRSKLYIFDGRGRHLRTLDAFTGAVRYQFSYDDTGRLTAVRDGDGNVTTIERDATGNPQAIVGPFDHRTTLMLDPDGYLAAVTNPADETVRFSYTDGGLLTSTIDPENNRYRFEYDAQGRLIRDDDPAGGSQALARATEDGAYEVLRTTALGRRIGYRVESLSTGDRRQVNTFSDGSQAEVLIRGDGSHTTRWPDGAVAESIEGPDPRWGMQGSLPIRQTVTTPGGLAATIATARSATLTDSNDLLSLVALTDTVTLNGRTYTTTYDAGSRTFLSTTPGGRQSTSTVDALGRVIRAQVGGLDEERLIYDDRGRLIRTVQASGSEARTIELSFNSDGLLQSRTDPLGRTVRFRYDAAGRVTQQILADGATIGYAYDANGNLTSVTPPGRPPHRLTYTAVGLRSTYTPPDVGTADSQTVYTYNADRQLTRIARPGGQIVGFDYDPTGRIRTITLPSGQVQYAYDPTTGQLTGITAPDGGTLTYRYDGFVSTSVTWGGMISGVVSRTHDNDFRITTQSVNGGDTISFQYDTDGLLVRAGDLLFSRNAQNGLLTGTVLGTITDTWRYNGFGEPVSYRATYTGVPLYAAQYARDKLGRIIKKTETVNGSTHVYDYTYDVVGRLTEVKQDGIKVSTYGYDANGNRISFSDPNGTTTGSYDAQDRLLRYGDVTYTYTANGELLSKSVGGQTTTYQYDGLGNLKMVALPGGTRIEYLTDGRNRRVGRRVNGVLVQGFLYQDGLSPIAELDGRNDIVSRFVYGSRANVPDYMIKGGAMYRIIADHLGSPRLVVDVATGAIAQRMEYDEFGRVTQDTNPGFQPFGFAGGLYDADTTLTRFGLRDYDAATGRWTAKDPLGVSGGVNLYRYVDNDPINLVDVDGRQLGKVVSYLLRKAAEALVKSKLREIEGPGPFDNELNTGEDELIAQTRRDIDGDGESDWFDDDDDNDGIPDTIDDDRDGDGIKNEVDREPEIPLLPLEILWLSEELMACPP